MGTATYRVAASVDARHIRMARAGLGLSVRDLAERAGLNKATVVRLEAGMAVRAGTVQAVKSALETEGVEFLANGRTGSVCVSITGK